MKQKFNKILKVIPIWILLVIITSLGFNKLVDADYNTLDDIDKNMLKQLSQVYETYNNKSEDIWKIDYKFNNIPLVLTPVKKDSGSLHTYSYVIGVDKFKDSVFSKKIEVPKEMNLPPVYRVSFISPSLVSTWMPYNFTFKDIGNQHVTFFKYNPMNIQELNSGFKYFLMHEVFHEYRQVPLWKNVDDLNSSIYVEKRDKEQYKLFLTELAILDKANSVSDKNQLLNILSDFVTVRDARYNKFKYMKEEKGIETIEGCAQYVEYKYSKQVGDNYKHPFNGDEGNKKYIDTFSKKSLLEITSTTTIDSLMDKNLYYYIGSSEGLILDKLQVNWKDRVENNELIYDILRDEVLKQKSGKGKSLEDIKKDYGYNNFDESAQIIIDNLK